MFINSVSLSIFKSVERFSKISSSDAVVSHSTFDALRLRKSGQFIVACLLRWISRTYKCLLALPPLRERIPSSFRQKVWLSIPNPAKKKSIFLESYYSDLSKTTSNTADGSLQRLQCTCLEKAQTTMTPLCNRVCYFLKYDIFVLQDLKNLRTRLYSAVKYFELSYTNDGDTQSVVGTQKDYAIKALVNTADHLGSVTYEANEYVDEKVDQVAGTELRVACIDQRVKRLLGGSLSRTSTIIC
ncbi:unnamed protein product [Brassica oleracea]